MRRKAMPDVEVCQTPPALLAEEIRAGDRGLERVADDGCRTGVNRLAPGVRGLHLETGAKLLFELGFQGVIERVPAPVDTANGSEGFIDDAATTSRRKDVQLGLRALRCGHSGGGDGHQEAVRRVYREQAVDVIVALQHVHAPSAQITGQ